MQYDTTDTKLMAMIMQRKRAMAVVVAYTDYKLSQRTNIMKVWFKKGQQDFAAGNTTMPLLIGSPDPSYDIVICLVEEVQEHGGLYLSCVQTLVQ